MVYSQDSLNMSSRIALLLGTLFIAYLLKVDHKRSRGVSSALWIPTIWMMIVGSRMVSLWFTQGYGTISPEDYLEGSPIDRMIFIVLIIAACVVLFRRNVNWSAIIKNNRWLVLLFAYCAISILWSDFPFVSFKRYVKKDIGHFLMVLVVLTDRYPAEAVKELFRRVAYVLVPLSVILYKYYPSLGRAYHPHSGELMITGVATGKNGLGLLCLISSIFLFWQITANWRKNDTVTTKKETLIDSVILLIAIWLLIEVDSSTCLICFIVGIGLLLAFHTSVFKRNKNRIGISLTFGLISLTPFLLLGQIFIVHTIVDLTAHGDTFWGRVSMWPGLLNLMNVSHLVGTGYDSYWLGERMARLWNIYWWHPAEAHNGYVGVFLELGYIGLIALIGVIVSTYRNVSRRLVVDYHFGQLALTFFLLALLYNVTEEAWKGLHLMWFVFLLFAIESSRPVTGLLRAKPLSSEISEKHL